MPVLVATITPKPGKLDDVEAALTALIPAVHDEDGCQLYALHRGKDRLVFVEKWRDGDALAAHGKGPNMAAVGAAVKGLVDGPPDVVILEAVPAGDATKGAI